MSPKHGTGGDDTMVSVVRAWSYDQTELDRVLEQAMQGLGGIEAFLPDEGTVLLKPNFLVPKKVD